MSQLQSPVQTPVCRKRVHSVTPPGTPFGDDNDITAVEESSDEEDEDSEQHEDDPPDDPPAVIEVPWKSNAKFLGSYLLRRGDRRIQTHTSLVGGRYYAPLETREGFYKKYYAEFVRWFDEWTLNPAYHPSLYLTERYNGEFFRFFIDIDYKWTEDNPPTVLDTLKRVTDGVSWMLGYLDAFPDRGLEVRASKRTDYRRHFVFPQVIVNDRYAAPFAKAVEMHVNNTAKARLANNAEFPEFAHDTIPLIEFDMQVYQKGSLRMLGSCKRSALEASHAKETDFFYLPIDPTTGERKDYFTYEEFMRHTVLLDEETHDRVESAMNTDDRVVYYPSDDSSGELYVTTKFIGSGAPVGSQPRMYAESIYSGPCEVSPSSALHKCLLDHYGEVVASNTGRITHDPTWNSLKIPVDRTTFCPLAGREHTSNHSFITLSKRGMRVMCYSSNEPACRDGGEWIPLKQLPEEVVQMLPPEPVNADNSALEVVRKEWGNGDKGLAKILHHFLVNDAMYSKSTKSLYHYDEGKCLWMNTTQNEFKWVMSDVIEKALRPLVKKYVDDASKEPDKKKKEMLDQWAADVLGIIKKYSSTRALSLLYPLFEGLVTYKDVESKFDRIPYLLGVANGVIDLRTGELRARTREDNLFRISSIVYDPEADTSFVEEMYSSIMADDEEMKRFLQLCLGYAITGESKEEIVLVFTGVGRNGKGGTIQTIKKIMGAFMATLNNGLILKRKSGVGNMDAERGRLRGLRIALFNEIGDGEVLNTAELQMLSGRDGISINEKYMTPTELENPSHKCIITTNWSPTIPLKEVTTSIIERMIIINFPVTFTDLQGEEPTIHRRQVVRELKDDLEKKLPVFLKWIVMGAVAYYREGGGLKAKSPQKVKDSTDAYFAKQDTVRKFIDQECIRGDTDDFFEECNSFFAHFQEFDNLVDKTNFVFGLKQLGITSKQVRIPGTKLRQTRYIGVRMRPVEALEEGACRNDEPEDEMPVI